MLKQTNDTPIVGTRVGYLANYSDGGFESKHRGTVVEIVPYNNYRINFFGKFEFIRKIN